MQITGAFVIFFTGYILKPQPKIELKGGKYSNKNLRVAISGSQMRRRLWGR
jgi:hypothetical protein